MAYEDEMIVTNLTVWEDLESLKNFVYHTVHTYFLRSRKKWFDHLSDYYMVLWWIEAGHIPTVTEGKEKLRCFAENGPTPEAFSFQVPFDSQGNRGNSHG